MSPLCTALVVAALGQALQPDQSAPSPQTATELRAKVRSALSGARGARPAPSTVHALIAVYKTLQQDQLLAPGQRNKLTTTVRTRLLGIHRQLPRSGNAGRELRNMGVFAQRRPALPAAARERDAAEPGQNGAEKLADLIGDMVAPESWEQRGGPGRIHAFGMPVAAQRQAFPQGQPQQRPIPFFGPPPLVQQADDAGEDLAKLIEDVVAPDTWEGRGGPGVIRYWGPGKSLVVRQTQDVHENVINLVEQLRR